MKHAERPHSINSWKEFQVRPCYEAEDSELPRGIASGSWQPRELERQMPVREERVASDIPSLRALLSVQEGRAFILEKLRGGGFPLKCSRVAA